MLTFYPVDVKDLQAPQSTYHLEVNRNEHVATQFSWDEQHSWLTATAISDQLKWGSKELSRLHLELSHLYADDEYDEDFLRPTKSAIYKARLWLTKVSRILSDLPMGSHVSTDGSGGVRIEWSVGEKNVRLVIAARPSSKSYIYHEAGSEYGVDRSISPETISRWLKWLVA
jgi:hypothetical protein